MSHPDFSRRAFLSTSLIVVGAPSLVFACTRTPSAAAETAASSSAPRVCRATDANIEGPYYRDGAPFRANLVDAGIPGTPLAVSGSILSLDCRSPLAGAVIDVWQADGEGHYDNDGTLASDAIRLRGKVRADSKGTFAFRTVIPGRYLNGRQYRPAHVHVKVTAPGHRPLTTQLYFPDDPYNAVDPFIRRSLIMDVVGGTSGKAARYDFVLIPS